MTTRRKFLASTALGAATMGLGRGARADAFAEVTEKLKAMPTTSFMVVSTGRTVFTYGNVAEVSYLASARKSILSMLFGRYVANGTLDLDATMEDMRIDDVGGLLPIEKTAKVRDLLIASSGVYHPASSPGDDPKVPERGSQKPGAHFHYNNWDFNVLGAIFEKRVGKSVAQALADDFGRPLGFEDYKVSRQRMLGIESRSRYLAYHLFMSARDMAKLGQLMAKRGRWQGHELIPEDWVRDSTKPHVAAADVGRGGELAYGYLWWIPVTRTSARWARACLMSGQFGQFVLALPTIDMVIVHRRAVSDDYAIARNLGKDNSEPTRVQAAEFLKLADLIVAARAD